MPGLVKGARRARELLPGDVAIGDALSTAAGRPTDVVARFLAEADERPSAVREFGLGALQVLQAFSERQGRGRGESDLAILFTDLAGFSSWALEAGDETALELLRAVGQTVEPAIRRRRGEIVKRLGDGHMAVFADSVDAVEAAIECQARLREVEVGGYRPELRAGVHRGNPRGLGGDYLGVDVNIAARVADAAGPCEVLVSDPVREALDAKAFDFSKQRRFRAKGVPRDLDVYAVKPRG